MDKSSDIHIVYTSISRQPLDTINVPHVYVLLRPACLILCLQCKSAFFAIFTTIRYAL